MTDTEFESLLAKARTIRMDAWQWRAQRIDFAVGNVMAMGSYTGVPDEWELRLTVAKEMER